MSYPPTNTALAKAIGTRLRELRAQAGLSLTEVARRIGSHRPIVGRAEAGRHVLTIEELQRYAGLYGMGIVALLKPVDVDGLVAIDARHAQVEKVSAA